MRSGVNGTPTFFINDYRYNGHTFEAMLEPLESRGEKDEPRRTERIRRPFYSFVSSCLRGQFFCAADYNLRPNKKLIEFGWDEPDTAYMQHIAAMEQTPFTAAFITSSTTSPMGKGRFSLGAGGTNVHREFDRPHGPI